MRRLRPDILIPAKTRTALGTASYLPVYTWSIISHAHRGSRSTTPRTASRAGPPSVARQPSLSWESARLASTSSSFSRPRGAALRRSCLAARSRPYSNRAPTKDHWFLPPRPAAPHAKRSRSEPVPACRMGERARRKCSADATAPATTARSSGFALLRMADCGWRHCRSSRSAICEETATPFWFRALEGPATERRIDYASRQCRGRRQTSHRDAATDDSPAVTPETVRYSPNDPSHSVRIDTFRNGRMRSGVTRSIWDLTPRARQVAKIQASTTSLAPISLCADRVRPIA